MSKVKITNGKTLTYKFNQKIFSEIEAIQNALMVKSISEVPDQATISQVRNLNFRASRIKKSTYCSPKLLRLDFNELLNLMQQKVNALERGKSISRARAVAKLHRQIV